jgi:hypothetical protein
MSNITRCFGPIYFPDRGLYVFIMKPPTYDFVQKSCQLYLQFLAFAQILSEIHSYKRCKIHTRLASLVITLKISNDQTKASPRFQCEFKIH